VYLGDAARTHFAGAAQITKKNVASLTMAWTYDTGDFGSGVSTMQTSPLVVDGVLYGLTPTLNAFALNAADGAELWRYESQTAPGVQRGLMWLESDSGNRLLYTAGDWLIALDPTSGRGIDGFGEGGRLDLAALLDVDRVAAPVPGVVAEGLVILGLATDDGGAVVAIEATTGQLRWRYDPVAGGRGGAADVGIAYDSKRGLVFVPTGPPSPPYTGASRPGDNLYADTLLALDAKTGELEWHHQVVRHGLWGRELGAPPTLVQIEGNDGPVDAVALATRSGDLYVFDRESGLPLYGTSEVSVPSSTVPGEAAAETQRVSDVTFTSAPFSVTNRSESAAASVALALGDARRSRFAPPGTDGSVLFPGVDAGVGWGGLAYGVAIRTSTCDTARAVTGSSARASRATVPTAMVRVGRAWSALAAA
jgi:quinoprotein glucose dehydrogenase